jgi:peptidyl-prolyl cis-trans isomerase D
MLQRIGDGLKGHKWLAYSLLGALGLVFAAWGAYGIVDISFGPGAHAAKVNGETIPTEQVREAWMQQQSMWQQRFGGEIPEDQKGRLQDQLLESFVRDTLLADRTRELGYRVSAEQLAAAIRNEPAFQIDGRYSPEVAKSRLAQAGISAQAFEADMRMALQRAQVQNAIRLSEFVTPNELERIFALENEQREVRYALLPSEKFAGTASIEESAITDYYKLNQQDFMTPESVHLRYGELRLEQLASQVTISDEELREAYEASKDRYVEPERRRARHVLIKPAAQNDAADAAARKKAQEVLEEAKSGKDFAALAQKYSEDPGSAKQGGDLGWAERSYFVGPFADAVFSMTPDEIRGPVKSEFGYHIVRLDEVQPGKAKSFEEARGELEAQLRRDRTGELFGDRQEQIELRIEQAGGDLDALAREFDLKVGEVKEFMRGGGGAPLGASPELQETVFGDTVLNQRKIGGPLFLGEDRLVVVQVLEHRKPEVRPLAEVREQIVAALREKRGTQAAQKAAAKAEERLAKGDSLEAVAGDLGVTAEPARFIGRFDPSVPAQVREQAFALPKPAEEPSVGAVTLDEGGAAVLVVSDVRTEALGDNAELRAQRVQQTQSRLAMGDVAAYVEEMRRTADVSKNPQAFE